MATLRIFHVILTNRKSFTFRSHTKNHNAKGRRSLFNILIAWLSVNHNSFEKIIAEKPVLCYHCKGQKIIQEFYEAIYSFKSGQKFILFLGEYKSGEFL